jgi:hypothetical protein
LTPVLNDTRERKSTIILSLPWPPPKPGISILIAKSPIAAYSIYFGMSEWHLVSPLPWFFFRPMRREHGKTFDALCGDMEKLTLFRGLNGDAKKQAQEIFTRLCRELRALAAKEGGAR